MTLAETGDLTRVEAGILYAELQRQEVHSTAQTVLFLLPAFQACGLTAVGSKRAAQKANEIFRKIQQDLNRINNGE